MSDSNQTPLKKWPIVYHSKYNVKFLGFEKLHPFDTTKWGNIVQHLKDAHLFENNIHSPSKIKRNELLKVHTKRYLKSLNWSFRVAAVTQVYLIAIVPNFMVQKFYLRRMRYQVGGTMLVGRLALEKGWAINIGGGFHHCCKDKGEGFCPYADITLLIHDLFEDTDSGVQKVMIVDLDAHQGNGHEKDFLGDDRVFILDAYNSDIYPQDEGAKQAIRCPIELKSYTADEEYLSLINRHLEESLIKFRPDIIVYNAGTDILKGDRLGKLSISAQGIIKRDRIVFMKAREHRIPIAMVTSGGYLRCTAKIIADSILNLVHLGLVSLR